MKRFAGLVMLTTAVLMAQEHYAKVEPYEIRSIAANVSGKVLHADEQMQGQRLGTSPFIVVDDQLDRIELEKVNKKIALLHTTLKLNEELRQNYQETYARKMANYEKIKELKIKSTLEKDRELYEMLASQNALISLDKEMASLQIQINDLELRRAQLEKSIRDKHLSAENMVLYELLVQEGQVVSMGTPLAKVADVSKAILTIYLSREEAGGLDEKVLYIDGKKSDYTISRLWNIADAQFLSDYKAQIVIDAPKRFSSLLKVELRDE